MILYDTVSILEISTDEQLIKSYIIKVTLQFF